MRGTLFGLLVLGPMVWTGAWFAVAAVVERSVVGQRGPRVAFESGVVAGFPLLWRMRLERVVWTPPAGDGARLEADALDVVVNATSPRTFALAPASELRWLPAARPPMRFTVGAGALALVVDGDSRLRDVDAAFTDVSWIERPGAAPVRVARLIAAIRTDADAPPHLSLQIDNAAFGADRLSPLGSLLLRASVEAVVHPPVGRRIERVPAWGEPIRRLELTRLVVRWGQLEIEGAAGLDFAVGAWPRGEFKGHVQGLDAAASEFYAHGMIRQTDAFEATDASRREGTNGRYEISLRDFALTLATLPVLFVPPLGR